MSDALETLLLVFSSDTGIGVPERALFLGAEPHPVLADWPDVVGWQPSKRWAQKWDEAGFERVDELSGGKWPVVMLLPGKSRDETLGWFGLARERLAEGGRLVVAMPNDGGARRFEKELSKAAGPLVSLQKHRCRAFAAIENGGWNEALFREWRQLAEPRPVEGGRWMTQPGVFSSEHVDPGSRLLAEYLPVTLSGEIADLGAGWGYLAGTALERCAGISRVDLFEVDARALVCARMNLARFEGKARYFWHDVERGVPGGYDVVLMNPPFHSGLATDVGLGRAFVVSAAAALKRGGRLFLVANRQLPYEAVLDAAGMAWRMVREDGPYKIIIATKR